MNGLVVFMQVVRLPPALREKVVRQMKVVWHHEFKSNDWKYDQTYHRLRGRSVDAVRIAHQQCVAIVGVLCVGTVQSSAEGVP